MIVAELLTKLGFQVDNQKLHSGVAQAKSALTEFKGFVGKLALGYGFFEIATGMVSAASELETMGAQFEVMLGSVSKAATLTKEIQAYAAKTSFETPDVSRSIQTLMQFGQTAEQSMATTKRLGDVAGADKNRFQSLSLAMAQVSSAGRLQGQDLLQLINAGWNPLRQIADRTHTSMADVRKSMEKGAISYDMVKQALEDVTSKGGMFYGNQARQSKTWAGVVSTAIDNVKLNAAKAVTNLFPLMKRLVTIIGEIPLEWLGTVFKTLADALDYIWKVAGPGIMDAFSQMQEGFEILAEAVGVFVGGTHGAGNSLTNFAVVLGFVLSRFLIGVAVVMRFTAVLLKHKAILFGIGLAMIYAFGPSKITLLRGVVTGLNMVRGAMNMLTTSTGAYGATMKYVGGMMDNFRWSKVGALKQAFFDLRTTITGARMSMNGFFASSQIGMGLLVAATGWAIGKIVECYHALSGLLDEEEHQNRLAQIAELQTQRGLNVMEARRERKAGNNAEANRLDWRNLGLDAQIKALQDQDKAASPAEEDDGFAAFQKQMAEEGEKSRKLQEQQLEEMKKQAAESKALPSNIAISLHNKSGAGATGLMPDDVLQLANKAVRAAFNVHLQRAVVEAA